MTTTTSGTIESVQPVSLGDTLVADVLAGVTSITVTNTVDFDAVSGGTLSIGGHLYTYSGVDEDAGTMTISPGLVANASQNDRVDVWDVSAGAAAVEYRALVALPDDVDNVDSIDALVSLPMVPLLPLGLRDPGEGETVSLQEFDGEWTVVDAPGKTPQLDGSLMRPATIPQAALGFTLPGGTKVTVDTVAPSTPAAGDLWIAVNLTDPTRNTVNQWDGAVWQPVQFGTDAIAAGSITAELLAADSIVAGKIATGALDAFAITAASLSAITMSGALTGSEIDASDFVIDNSGGRVLVYQLAGQTVTVLDTPGAGSWSVPGGITAVKVECTGGGGGGGGGGAFDASGGGGGGGDYCRANFYAVTPLSSVPYVIGAGGTGGTPSGGFGTIGGATTWDGAAITAYGGREAGDNTSTPSSPGGGTQFHNGPDASSVRFVGGTGGAGHFNAVANSSGGGGGAAAGSRNNGAAGTDYLHATPPSTPGVPPGGAAANGGGAGGAGGAYNAAGSTGVVPGGGGGGGGWNGSPHAGGDGAHGRITITYGGTRILVASIASDPGVDDFGNAYPAGLMVYPTVTTDWNNANTPGPWLGVAGSQANSPDNTKTWTGEVYGRLSTGTLVQVVNRLAGGDATEMWSRQFSSGGGWQPWHCIYSNLGWTNLTLKAGFSNSGPISLQPAYQVIGSVVHLRGYANGTFTAGGTNDIVAAGGIPAGLRPAQDRYEPCAANGVANAAFLIIRSDGSITVRSGGTAPAWVSLAVAPWIGEN